MVYTILFFIVAMLFFLWAAGAGRDFFGKVLWGLVSLIGIALLWFHPINTIVAILAGLYLVIMAALYGKELDNEGLPKKGWLQFAIGFILLIIIALTFLL